MSNKKKAKKKTLSAKDIIELVIKAMLAAAALIQSIKSQQTARGGAKAPNPLPYSNIPFLIKQ